MAFDPEKVERRNLIYNDNDVAGMDIDPYGLWVSYQDFDTLHEMYKVLKEKRNPQTPSDYPRKGL